MKRHIEDKTQVVNNVFSSVYRKYDFMNDVMSFGIHRIWKKNMINWMKPDASSNLLDVASGTGDLARIFSEETERRNY